MKKGLIQPMRHGTNEKLEELADLMIYPTVPRGGPKHGEIIVPWKVITNKRREVLSEFPIDPSARQGMYNRSAHRGRPWLNGRDGIASLGGRRDLIRDYDGKMRGGLSIAERYDLEGTTEMGRHHPFAWLMLLNETDPSPRTAEVTHPANRPKRSRSVR